MPSLVIRGLTSGLLVSQGYGEGSSPPTGFTLISAISTGSLLTLTFTENLALSGPAAIFSNYFVTGEPLYPEPLITGLTVVNSTLLLDITEQHDGGSYQINIPISGFHSVSASPYLSSYTPGFIGIGVDPGLLMSRMVDARTVEVIYTEPVNVLDALDPQNYSINSGAQVFSVTQISPIIYRLSTSRVDVNTMDTYVLTVTGIRDLEGNPLI